MYLRRKAFDSFKKDTVKQPSASVKPDNQLSLILGKLSLNLNSTSAGQEAGVLFSDSVLKILLRVEPLIIFWISYINFYNILFLNNYNI